MNQVEALEQAILARAERLAEEYHERAKRSCDSILREAAERLRARESREEDLAKSLGERVLRQQVQASELKMQTHLDRVRWNLVQTVERGLQERMRQFMSDQDAYARWLDGLIVRAVELIEREQLIVAVNAQDLGPLRARWDALSEQLPTGKTVTLSDTPIEALGGVLVSDTDRRIRIDNTYEGRLERLRPSVRQTILERLLPSGFDTGNIFGG